MFRKLDMRLCGEQIIKQVIIKGEDLRNTKRLFKCLGFGGITEKGYMLVFRKPLRNVFFVVDINLKLKLFVSGLYYYANGKLGRLRDCSSAENQVI